MERYNNFNILVIGDFMLDKYLEGKPTKVSQEAPVLVVKHTGERSILGGAGNVVNNLISLGAKVYAAGVIGKDLEGQQLKELLQFSDVNVDCIVEETTMPTISKTRIVAKGQHLIRYDIEGEEKVSQETGTLLNKRIIGLVERVKIDAIIVADYDKYVVTNSLMDCLRQTKRPIFINGKPENADTYSSCEILVLNDFEYIESLRKLELKNATELIQKLSCSAILHTRGDQGIILHQINNEKLFLANKVTEVDPTGASDTVISVFVLEYLRRYNIIEAIELANKAASIIVTKFGTNPITMSELKDSFRKEE